MIFDPAYVQLRNELARFKIAPVPRKGLKREHGEDRLLADPNPRLSLQL